MPHDAPPSRDDLERLIERVEEARRRLAPLLPDMDPGDMQEGGNVLTILTTRTPIDLIFDQISGDLSFQSIRSRSVRIQVEGAVATVACLEDVIKSKEAADRPKDRVALPILRDTLRIKKALEDGKA